MHPYWAMHIWHGAKQGGIARRRRTVRKRSAGRSKVESNIKVRRSDASKKERKKDREKKAHEWETRVAL